MRNDRNGEQDARNGVQHIQQTHDDVIGMAAIVAGDGTENTADDNRDRCRGKSDDQRDSGTEYDSGEQIPAEVVRTEWVHKAWRQDGTVIVIDRDAVIKGKQTAYRQTEQEDHKEQSGHGRRVGSKLHPHVAPAGHRRIAVLAYLRKQVDAEHQGKILPVTAVRMSGKASQAIREVQNSL